MTNRLLLAVFLAASALATSADLSACGDKFLVVGRGTRFQRAAAARTPASILVYANPSSNIPKALANVPVETVLRKAGYKPTTVTSAVDFDAAVGRGGWDLVLIDFADSTSVSSRVRSDAIVLPVVFNLSGAELAQALRQYQRVLKSPTKNQAFLEAIDDALALRARQAKASSPKAND